MKLSLLSTVSFANTNSGLLTLGLQANNFPVADAAKVISASKNPAFGYVHQAFGSRYANVKALIKRLSPRHPDSGNTLLVSVYGDCGPCRIPRRKQVKFNIVNPELSIPALNLALARNSRNAIGAHVKRYESAKHHMPQVTGTRYVFYPSLEDNFSGRSFEVVWAIAQQVFADRPDVTLGRNPQVVRQARYPIEAHQFKDLHLLKAGDTFAADGELILFPGEECTGPSQTSKSAGVILQNSLRSGVNFLLWRPENQGLPLCASGSATSDIAPDRRTYRVTHIADLRHLLRTK